MRIVGLFLVLTALVCAQEALTNDSIVKMVKAGLSENLIVSEIRRQPGKYSLTRDDILKLLQQGVSSRILAAMFGRGSFDAGAVPPAAPPPHGAATKRPGGMLGAGCLNCLSATARVTTRSFLTPLGTEKTGYGLYSYILFGSRPESLASDRWRRYYQTILAYWGLPISDDVLRYVSPPRMNVTFLPITCYERELPIDSSRPFHFDRERLAMHRMEHQAAGNAFLYHDANQMGGTLDASGTACVLVGNYDYARAQVLLSLFGGSHLEGPYIVSTTQPLSNSGTLPSQYLYQDLSSVPAEVIPLWMKEFMAQAQEQEFWKTRTKEQFILRLRTVIELASQQIPDFGNAVTWRFAGAHSQR